MGLMEKIFGDLNEKEVKKIGKIVDQVEALDEQMQALAMRSCRRRRRSSGKDCKTERLWTIFCQRPLRSVEKAHGEAWA